MAAEKKSSDNEKIELLKDYKTLPLLWNQNEKSPKKTDLSLPLHSSANNKCETQDVRDLACLPSCLLLYVLQGVQKVANM